MTRLDLKKDGSISPDALQKRITDLAEWNGWAWRHETDSRWSKPGKLDLELIRVRNAHKYSMHENFIWVELKTSGDKVTRAQQEEIDRIRDAGGKVFVWGSRHWDDGTIERALANLVVGQFENERDSVD